MPVDQGKRRCLATDHGPRTKDKGPRPAFTLLELLIVVAILAIIAGGMVITVGGTEEQAAEQVTHSEMAELKKAILQFERDTGWLPKTGPFDLASNDGAVVDLPDYVPAGQEEEWFYSPANFWQLFENPLSEDRNNNGILDAGEDTNNNGVIDVFHPLGEWNPDTRRGWRGPYISLQGNAFVDVAVYDPAGDSAATWSAESGNVVQNIPAVNDPFVLPPKRPYFRTRQVPSTDPQYVESRHKYDRWGRPYFLFIPTQQDAFLVGLGPNGTYATDEAAQGRTPDDIVLHLFR